MIYKIRIILDFEEDILEMLKLRVTIPWKIFIT